MGKERMTDKTGMFLMKSSIALLFLANPAFAITLEKAKESAVKNSVKLTAIQAVATSYEARAEVVALSSRPEIGVALGAESDGNFSDREQLPLAYGYINWTIYDGFRASILQKANEAEMARTGFSRSLEEIEVRKKVEDLFLQISFQEELEKRIRTQLLSFGDLRKKAMARKNAGLIGDSDIAEFDLRRSDLEGDLEASQLQKKALLDKLSRLTKTEVDRLDDFVLPTIHSRSNEKAVTLKDNLQVRLIESKRGALRAAKDEANAKWGPRVDFEARAGRLPSEGDWNNKEERVDALIVAKWNLFGQRQRNAEIREIREQENILEANLAVAREERNLGIKEFLATLDMIERKSEILRRSRLAAQRYQRITLNEYERGVKDSSDAAYAADSIFANDRESLELRLQWARTKLELEALLF